MAIKYYETYPQRWESPSQDYPQGAFKNLSALGEQDGSYLEERWLNDQSGFFGALLRNAEMTPNGLVDTAQKSQFYDALLVCAKKAVNLADYYTKSQVDIAIQDNKTEVVNEWGDFSDKTLSQGFIKSNLGYVTPDMFKLPNDNFSDTMNRMFSSIKSGKILIPKGEYDLSNDIIIGTKALQDERNLIIDATGAVFTGVGRLILNSVKRVTLIGWQQPDKDLVIRGHWWCNFVSCKFSRLLVGDERGTTFSTNYWNNYYNLEVKTIVLDVNCDRFNSHNFYNTTSRGDGTQGFVGTADYFLEMNQVHTVQLLNFIGGDISYHKKDIIKYHPEIRETEITFKDIYFDFLTPNLRYGSSINVTLDRCHTANAMNNTVSLSTASTSFIEERRSDRIVTIKPSSAMNLISNGDFSTLRDSYLGNMFSTLGQYTLTNNLTDTPTGKGIKLAGSGTAFFNSITMNQTGKYSLRMLYRVNTMSADLRVNFNEKFTLLTNSAVAEWSVLDIGDNVSIAKGANVRLTINSTSPCDIDIAFVSVHLGRESPILPVNSNLKYQRNFVLGNREVGAGSTVHLTFNNVNYIDSQNWICKAITHLDDGENLVITSAGLRGNQVVFSIYNPTSATINTSGTRWQAKFEKVF